MHLPLIYVLPESIGMVIFYIWLAMRFLFALVLEFGYGECILASLIVIFCVEPDLCDVITWNRKEVR